MSTLGEGAIKHNPTEANALLIDPENAVHAPDVDYNVEPILKLLRGRAIEARTPRNCTWTPQTDVSCREDPKRG